MCYTDDPISDFHRHDAEREEKLKKLPVCDFCDEPIQDDFYYDIEGTIVCEICLDRFFKKDIDDFLG